MLCLTGSLLLAACGSAHHPAAASSAALGKTCTAVGATLADGPDPDSDPVGYAEAQIGPLGQIRTSDAALRTDIRALAAAYAAEFAHDGKSTADTKAVAAASKKIDSICPGATA
jgi:hypothetical protein